MTEQSNKQSKSLLVWIIIIAIISIGINVYLWRDAGQQEEAIAVVKDWVETQSWDATNAQIQADLSSITNILLELEAKQSGQETASGEILALLESQPWEGNQAQLEAELSSIALLLADVETRQSAQETAFEEIYALLESQPWDASQTQMQTELATISQTLVDLRELQAEQDSTSSFEALVDKSAWEANTVEVNEALASISARLADLEARQSAQEAASGEILALLERPEPVQIEEELATIKTLLVELETSQAAQAAAPSSDETLQEILTLLEGEPWAASNVQIQEEFAALTATLKDILVDLEQLEPSAAAPTEVDEQTTYAEQSENELVQVVMAPTQPNPCPEEQKFPVVVRLLPGDSVWSIVERFYGPPSPSLVNEVVEYNGIMDPTRLPVGFLVEIPSELVANRQRL